jgi:hypothetical protein
MDAEQETDRLHGKLGGDLGQEVVFGTADDRVQQPPRARPQILLQAANRPGGQAFRHKPPNTCVPRIVHHVQHDAGYRQVLQHGAAERPVATGFRGVGHRVVEDLFGFGVGVRRRVGLQIHPDAPAQRNDRRRCRHSSRGQEHQGTCSLRVARNRRQGILTKGIRQQRQGHRGPQRRERSGLLVAGLTRANDLVSTDSRDDLVGEL